MSFLIDETNQVTTFKVGSLYMHVPAHYYALNLHYEIVMYLGKYRDKRDIQHHVFYYIYDGERIEVNKPYSIIENWSTKQKEIQGIYNQVVEKPLDILNLNDVNENFRFACKVELDKEHEKEKLKLWYLQNLIYYPQLPRLEEEI